MGLALNNVRGLVCHKTQPTNYNLKKMKFTTNYVCKEMKGVKCF